MATTSSIPGISSLFSLPNRHQPQIFSPLCLNSSPKFHEVSSVTLNGARFLQKNSVCPDPSVRTIRVFGPDSKFFQVGPHFHSKRRILVHSMGDKSASVTSKVTGIMHLVVSLGIILAMDKFLKKAFVAAAIKFPSALFGMFCIFSVLMILDSTIPTAATSLINFFQPALLFIQRWLPLFYVPSLVVLPLAIKDIPAASGLKICFIIGIVVQLLEASLILWS